MSIDKYLLAPPTRKRGQQSRKWLERWRREEAAEDQLFEGE
jgi:hypothetical protein